MCRKLKCWSMIYRLRSLPIVVVLIGVLVGAAYAEVEFGELDLADDARLLFAADTQAPGLGEVRARYLADAGEQTLFPLTTLPEELSRTGDDPLLEIRNRFGLFHVSPVDGVIEEVEAYPGFSVGSDIELGKLEAVGSSPDGRYLTWIDREESESVAYGDLILHDREQDERYVIATRVERALSQPVVKWSPDSRFLVYTKNGSVYYHSVEAHERSRTLGESARRLTEGTLANVRWKSDNVLYLVRGTLIYRLEGSDFLSRSVLGEPLHAGEVIGKLPTAFDPNFDRFWLAPDQSYVLLSRGGRSLFVYALERDDYRDVSDSVGLPYRLFPRSATVEHVSWSERNTLTVLVASMKDGALSREVYRVHLDEAAGERFRKKEPADVRDIALSPDERLAVVVTGDGISLRNYETWVEIEQIDLDSNLEALWLDDESFVVAGRKRIDRFDRDGQERELVAFSQVEQIGYHRETGDILAEAGGVQARWLEEERRWTEWEPENGSDEELPIREQRRVSREFRVYLDSLRAGAYRNLIMVRRADGFGTTALFPRPERRYSPFPEEEEEVSLRNFTHGPRTRKRQVALVFNAVDSVEGLNEILRTLSNYRVESTFFVSGDFIRRHPGAAREIAASPHDVGNLFYSHIDLTDSRYDVGTEFVQRGLDRNEDEYFETTEEELSLLWHAPYYSVTEEILNAAETIGYTHVGRDVDSLDWVPRYEGPRTPSLYKRSGELVDRIVDRKKPGSIVSMTVGVPGENRRFGGRDDYLFHRLDVLLNALISRGYEIVPVSELLERVQ